MAKKTISSKPDTNLAKEMEEARQKDRNHRLTFWERPEQQAMLRSFARRGMSLNEIALRMGVTKPILVSWIKESIKLRTIFMENNVSSTYLAEDILERAVRDREEWAVKLYLKTFHSAIYDPERWIGCELPEEADTSLMLEVQDIVNGVYKPDEL